MTLHPTLHTPLTYLQRLRLMNRRRPKPMLPLPSMESMVARMNADQAAADAERKNDDQK